MEIIRYKYTDKDLDITIIEILNEDKINNFIEIDRYIYSKDYSKENIIFAYLKNGKKLETLKGIVQEKKNNIYNSTIKSIEEGVIILSDNFKSIGLTKKSNDMEKGLEFIPFNLFIDKINFIRCKYVIKKEDLEEEIQLINNRF